jgi:hypothetical protein
MEDFTRHPALELHPKSAYYFRVAKAQHPLRSARLQEDRGKRHKTHNMRAARSA